MKVYLEPVIKLLVYAYTQGLGVSEKKNTIV